MFRDTIILTSIAVCWFCDIGNAIFTYKSIGKPICRWSAQALYIDYPILLPMAHCRMKGFLSFLILWFVSRKSMTGAEIALELEKRKGRRPSPGTIYPVLKHLKDVGLLLIDESKRYSLTERGRRELDAHLSTFFKTFCDIDEMRSCHEDRCSCEKES